jgi:hypothetical protein
LGKATGSVEIEASPEKVFDFVISEKMNNLMKEVYECKLTSEGPIGLGSTLHYTGTHRYNKGEEWNAEVTEFVRNKKLTIHCKGANKHSNDQTNYYVFEPTTKGTNLTTSFEVKMPHSILGELFFALVAKRIVKKDMLPKEGNKISENLKKALET